MQYSYKLTTYNKNSLNNYKFVKGQSIFISTYFSLKEDIYLTPINISDVSLILSLYTSFGNLKLKDIELTDNTLIDTELNKVNLLHKIGIADFEVHTVIPPVVLDTYFSDLDISHLDTSVDINYELKLNNKLRSQFHTVIESGQFIIYN